MIDGTRAAASSMTSRLTHVGACTPLVIEPIGTSLGSKPGQSPANISRLTAPCSLLTPLARWASRRPMHAMLNTFGSPPGGSAPSARMRSTGMPGVALPPPNARTIMSRGNRSIPAGTGVCVVNTVAARVASRASWKFSPAEMYSRMRSSPRNPACPSLVWKTSGSGVAVTRLKARSARTPPMPSSIS